MHIANISKNVKYIPKGPKKPRNNGLIAIGACRIGSANNGVIAKKYVIDLTKNTPTNNINPIKYLDLVSK